MKFASTRHAFSVAILGAAITAALPLNAAYAAKPAHFDSKAWLQDYAYLKAQLEQRYSHLAWFASPQGGVDLPSLDRRTMRALVSAENDEDAMSAIRGFVAGFHDGHLAATPTLQPPNGQAKPKRLDLDGLSGSAACAAMGYVPDISIQFSQPFESLPGMSLQSDGVSRAFRAGIALSPQGTRIGIVRISHFRDKDVPPVACVDAWNAQRSVGPKIDYNALSQKVAEGWYQTFADQLKQFHNDGVAAVIVDIGGNPGGNDSGDWMARLLTSRDVHSARLLMTAAPAALGYFDQQITGLREALANYPKASGEAKEMLQSASAAFSQRKTQLEARKSKMSWVWREQRPWNPFGDSNLIEAGYASGHADFLPLGALGDSDLASYIYWPANVDPWRSAWSGPVYLLTDQKSGSSAEMFAAVMRDNGIAKTVGAPTAGSGAGSMYSEPGIELPYSHLRFKFPNSVRLRADGSDEVAGIQPDLPVLGTRGEDGRSRAMRILDVVDGDLRKGQQ